MPPTTESCQARFARRWAGLTRPHVRALAWLLSAPDLLDVHAPRWRGRIATIDGDDPALAAWLQGLERDPAPLDAALDGRVFTRLGLYAEKLLAFYLQQHGRLVAHSLQVRASRNDTVGEFDFLLDAGEQVDHWELATKFYLFDADAASFNRFVGPNLADSLGAKMDKILERQLELGSHPAAQALLPRPVRHAQALVKGWLFYPGGAAPQVDGIAPGHCRGFWCALAEVAALDDESYVVLPRMQWLAPFRGAPAQADVLARAALAAHMAQHFARSPMPVLVAAVRREGEALVETRRGFVVPDDWRARAGARRLAGQ